MPTLRACSAAEAAGRWIIYSATGACTFRWELSAKRSAQWADTAAACQAAFALLDSPEGEKLVKKLWANTKMFKRELKKRGFQFKVSETPIIPIHVGDASKAFEFSKKLFEAGVFAPAVGYPTVAEGKARLRAIVSATHKRDQLLRAADILAEVGKQLGVV